MHLSRPANLAVHRSPKDCPSDCPQCLLGLVFGDAKDDEPLPDGSGEARAEWAASPEAKDTEVGPFTLTRKIGEGGMGTV